MLTAASIARMVVPWQPDGKEATSPDKAGYAVRL